LATSRRRSILVFSLPLPFHKNFRLPPILKGSLKTSFQTSLQPLTFRLPPPHFFPHFAFTAATALSSFAPSTSPSKVCCAPHLGKRTTV
ncbi:hypothetical protein, partial [Kingella oralis]|uniref:hypothetical protein n=1 Tax=Kingella oralis TaxID=505 RepID=UPI003C6FE3DE